MSDNRAALAAAMAGGYLLGRTKKAKLALAVGSYLAGRRLGVTPGQVLSQSLGRLQEVPQLRELTDQVRGELLTAGRTAVTAAADRHLSRLADTLRDRTDALAETGRPAEDEDDSQDESEDEPPPRKAARKVTKKAVRKTAEKAASPARRRVPGGGRR